MSDADERLHPPFGGFRIRTEPMPDGRTIRYYEWEAEPDAGADRDPGDDTGAPAEPHQDRR